MIKCIKNTKNIEINMINKIYKMPVSLEIQRLFADLAQSVKHHVIGSKGLKELKTKLPKTINL